MATAALSVVLPLAPLIPFTFGGLFYLFALSLPAHSRNERLDVGHATFHVREPREPEEKEVPKLSPESRREKASFCRRFF
jgi:hypothetical protein